jgi:hypothetical protein
MRKSSDIVNWIAEGDNIGVGENINGILMGYVQPGGIRTHVEEVAAGV